MVSSCSVPNCVIGNQKISMHRFPAGDRDVQRYFAWLKAVNNKKLFTMPKHKISSGFRVCAKHFSADQWDPLEKGKLLAAAVPDINLYTTTTDSSEFEQKLSQIYEIDDDGDEQSSVQNSSESGVESTAIFEQRPNRNFLKASEALFYDPREGDKSLPTFEQFPTACRICLEPVCVADCLTVFHDKFNISIASLIEEYCRIKICNDEKQFPKHICSNCVNFLVDIHSFRSKGQRNNQYLRNLQDQHNKRISQSNAPKQYSRNVIAKASNGIITNKAKQTLSNIDESDVIIISDHTPQSPPPLVSLDQDHHIQNKRIKETEKRTVTVDTAHWIERRKLILKKGKLTKLSQQCKYCGRSLTSIKDCVNHSRYCKKRIAVTKKESNACSTRSLLRRPVETGP